MTGAPLFGSLEIKMDNVYIRYRENYYEGHTIVRVFSSLNQARFWLRDDNHKLDNSDCIVEVIDGEPQKVWEHDTENAEWVKQDYVYY